jgi:hypothetical protein
LVSISLPFDFLVKGLHKVIGYFTGLVNRDDFAAEKGKLNGYSLRA